MFAWIKLLFSDPNGDSHAAVEEFRKQKARSNGVKSEMTKVADQLKKSREAVQAKARAIQLEEGEERVSTEGLKPTEEPTPG
jgi:Skp family chaperone for outer membrane proteins